VPTLGGPCHRSRAVASTPPASPEPCFGDRKRKPNGRPATDIRAGRRFVTRVRLKKGREIKRSRVSPSAGRESASQGRWRRRSSIRGSGRIPLRPCLPSTATIGLAGPRQVTRPSLGATADTGNLRDATGAPPAIELTRPRARVARRPVTLARTHARQSGRRSRHGFAKRDSNVTSPFRGPRYQRSHRMPEARICPVAGTPRNAHLPASRSVFTPKRPSTMPAESTPLPSAKSRCGFAEVDVEVVHRADVPRTDAIEHGSPAAALCEPKRLGGPPACQ